MLFDTPLIYFFSTSSSQPKPILQQPTSVSPSKSVKKKKKGKDSATSSEEERWLDAIESGKLEEVGLSIMVQVYFEYYPCVGLHFFGKHRITSELKDIAAT